MRLLSLLRSGPSSPARLLGFRPGTLVTAVLMLAPAAAWAATGGKGPSEPLFVAQILVLVVAGRLMGEAMERMGQPSVMGQLIAGIALGPSLFGLLWPDAQQALFPHAPEQKSMIDAVGQLGVLLLLLLAGMETDLALVNKVRKAALSVSVTGVALPFACGFLLGEMLPDGMVADPAKRVVTSLFLGTALSISSVKIVAIIVRQMNFARRDVGQIILASAIIDDTIGWIIIAVTFGVATTGSLALLPLAKSIAGAVLFMGFSLTVGRRLVTLAIRLTNDHFVGELPVVSMVLVIMGVMALLTDALGLHTVLGAFVAGVLVGESPILTRQIEEQLRGLTTALFMPVFFGLSGLSTDLRVLADPHILAVSLGLIAIASIGKFSGAFVGGKLGGLGTRECLALGCGMNARGSTEVVVASIGLQMGALSQTLFTMIVAMAVVTTMIMPPSLRWALRRLPLRPEEAERLAREEFEAQGFVTRLERLLVLAEDGPGGRFVARLAGLLAGPMGVPVTTLVANRPDAAHAPAAPASPEKGVLLAAEQGRETAGTAEAGRTVDVVARTIEGERDAVVAAEAQRGYDILFVGLEDDASLQDEELGRTITAFGGPLALAAVRGVHRDDPSHGPHRILVPVNGTVASRRGLELALALARATRADITALHVREKGRRSRRFGLGRRQDLAVLREAVSLAEQMDVPLRTRVHRRAAPAEAAVAEARRGYDLVVVGVAKRAGPSPVSGTVAESLIEDATVSIVVVGT